MRRQPKHVKETTASRKTEPRKKWVEPRLSTEVIKGLALGILKSEIFTSDQVKEEDRHLLPAIFLPIESLSDEEEKEWAVHAPSLIYAYSKDALLYRKINGYPVFDTICLLWTQDAELLTRYCQRLRAAVNAVMEGDEALGKRPSPRPVNAQPSAGPTGRLQSVKDFAACLGLSVWTVRGWAYRGRVASIKLGARMMIPTTELDRLISENLRPACNHK